MFPHCKNKNDKGMANKCTLHCAIGILLFYIVIVLTLIIFILETKTFHREKTGKEINQKKEGLVHKIDLGNNKTFIVINNICINEKKIIRTENISITAHGSTTYTQETFYGFTVKFLPDELPPNSYKENHVAYFLDIISLTHNLHHFFKDLAVTLFSILKKLHTLKNVTNR